MSSKRAILDYKAFMNWFGEKYPELFKLHRDTIIAPVDGEGVTVDKDGMDAETYKKVIAATKEYYQNEQGIQTGTDNATNNLRGA
jgi:hypothetical protein